MPWGAAVAAGGSIISSGKNKKASDKANKMSTMQPFSVAGPGGSAQVTATGVSGQGGLGSAAGTPFDQATLAFLSEAMGSPSGAFNLNPGDVLGIGQRPNAQADGFMAKSQGFLDSLTSFNPDAYATQQFERLNRLAAPGEDSAARSTANSLFSRGRLGVNDTRSGQVFRDLDLSQSMARDNRLLQSIGLAGTEQDRLVSNATSFGLNAENLRTSGVNRDLAGVNAALGVGQFQNAIQGSQLQNALSAQQGVIGSTVGAQQAIQNALAGSGISTNARVGAASNTQAAGTANANALAEAAAGFGSAYYGSKNR